MNEYQPITLALLEQFEDSDGGATIMCVKSKYDAAAKKQNKALEVVGDVSYVHAEYLANVNNWDSLMRNYQIKVA